MSPRPKRRFHVSDSLLCERGEECERLHSYGNPPTITEQHAGQLLDPANVVWTCGCEQTFPTYQAWSVHAHQHITAHHDSPDNRQRAMVDLPPLPLPLPLDLAGTVVLPPEEDDDDD